MKAAKQEIAIADNGSVTRTPMDLLNQAVANGNIELAEKLMGLQERWEKNQARKAFDNAIASAKSDLPVIVKTNSVSFGAGKTSYKFEDLATIAKAVDPILAANGLSYRFRTHSEPGTVTVTCIISHKDGHSEENSLTGPNDTSGSKNPMQAIGSSVTYLQRYTLKAALGLSSSADTDANVEKEPEAETIMEDQIKSIEDLIAKKGGKRSEELKKVVLLKYGLGSIADIKTAEYAKIFKTLDKKADAQ